MFLFLQLVNIDYHRKMRRHLLAFIAGFLTLCIGFSACLNSDEKYTYSSDATIQAFALDEVNGVDYKFTIDQLNRIIYNADSMPVGADTIIDRILIKTLTTSGYYISSGAAAGLMDTLFSTSDSVDLRNPIVLTVHAADGGTKRDYTIRVNVHRQDPDSLVWDDENSLTGFYTDALGERQQAVILKENLFVYANIHGDIEAREMSVAVPGEYAWSTPSISGLPEDVRLNSLTNFRDRLYAATESGDIYRSDDGYAWTRIESLSGNVKTLVCALPDVLSAVIADPESGKEHFCTTDGEGDTPVWTEGEEPEEGFPTDNLSSTLLTTATGIAKAVVVGDPETGDTQTVPWFTTDGRGWADLSTTSDLYCPPLNRPVILYYDGAYYLSGSGLDTFYTSQTGIAWKSVTKKFRWPASIKGRAFRSIAVDRHQYIWLIVGGTDNRPNEVWRGRLNRLGFEHR